MTNPIEEYERSARAFIRIGGRKFIEQLVNDGLVYLNTVDYFKETEDNKLRGDELEGTSYMLDGLSMKLFHDGKQIGYANSVRLNTRNEVDNGNVYCLTTIWEDEWEDFLSERLVMDKKLTEFGDAFTFIHNPKEFYNRLAESLEKQGLKHTMAAVTYHDPKDVNGRWGIFRKPQLYAYQREARLFVKTAGEQPLQLSIGNISDIAVIHHISDFFKP